MAAVISSIAASKRGRAVDVGAAAPPRAHDRAVRPRDERDRLGVAAVDAEDDAHRASSRSGRWAACAVGQLVVHGLRPIDRLDEGVRGERPDRVGPRALPGRLRREHLVLGEHLDEPDARGVAAASAAAARSSRLEHLPVISTTTSSGNPGSAPPRFGHVHREDVAGVVEHRVHRVDRELELVDAAARAAGSSTGSSRLGLLRVVLPVPRHPGQDVLRPGGGLRTLLREHLVAPVVVLEVVGRDRLHHGCEPQDALLRDVERRARPEPLPRCGLHVRHQIGAVVGVLDAPAGVVEADHRRAHPRGVETRGLRELRGEVVGALAQRHERDRGVSRPRLRHDVDRVRVVEDARLRADGLDVGRERLHHLDRTERHEEPADPLRLLPDQPVAVGGALVERTGLEAARPEAREDRVAAVEARAPVRRRA